MLLSESAKRESFIGSWALAWSKGVDIEVLVSEDAFLTSRPNLTQFMNILKKNKQQNRTFKTE